MRPRKPVVGLTLAVLAVALTLLWIGVDYLTRPRLITGPMVQMLTPEGFTVIWREHPSRASALEVQQPGGKPVGRFAASPAEDGQLVATATGLAAGSNYLYRLTYQLPAGRVAPLFQGAVRTAPTPGRPFRFVAFGDSGNGSTHQFQVARTLAGHDPDLIVHTGDLVYSYGRRENYLANFYRPYAALLPRIPFYPCLGNHDVRTENGQPLLDAFVLPRNGPPGLQPERHYWFDFGDARFVAMDEHLEDGQLAQLVPWLEQVLSSAGDRWRIAFFHEPLYTNSRYAGSEQFRAAVEPVFNQQRVALALCGHNHLYERTRPIRGGRIVGDGEGTFYVTSGAGGGHLYREAEHPPAYIVTFNDQVHSFTLVDVTPASLLLRQIDEDGVVLDESFISRPATTQPAPETQPGTQAQPGTQTRPGTQTLPETETQPGAQPAPTTGPARPA